jgi:DNA-binding transcriptional MocR family regulator
MVREVYQSRKNAVCDAIDKFVPMAKYIRPKGGYFVWVVLPETINTEEVLAISKEKYKVLFHPGTKCSCVGNFQNCLRLSFAHYAEEVLSDAVRKIGMAIDELSNK